MERCHYSGHLFFSGSLVTESFVWQVSFLGLSKAGVLGCVSTGIRDLISSRSKSRLLTEELCPSEVMTSYHLPFSAYLDRWQFSGNAES